MMLFFGRIDRPEDATSAQQELRHFQLLASEARKRRADARRAEFVRKLRDRLPL